MEAQQQLTCVLFRVSGTGAEYSGVVSPPTEPLATEIEGVEADGPPRPLPTALHTVPTRLCSSPAWLYTCDKHEIPTATALLVSKYRATGTSKKPDSEHARQPLHGRKRTRGAMGSVSPRTNQSADRRAVINQLPAAVEPRHHVPARPQVRARRQK